MHKALCTVIRANQNITHNKIISCQNLRHSQARFDLFYPFEIPIGVAFIWRFNSIIIEVASRLMLEPIFCPIFFSFSYSVYTVDKIDL